MLVCMLLPIIIHAEDKALLIGIGDYEAAPDLPGIQKDVNMMEMVVQKLGFSECACVDEPTSDISKHEEKH